MNKIIRMPRERWQKIRKKGIGSYLIYTGVFYFGLICGLMFHAVSHLVSINYDFSKFNFTSMFDDYVSYTPITIALGVVCAYIFWYQFEDKFGEKDC